MHALDADSLERREMWESDFVVVDQVVRVFLLMPCLCRLVSDTLKSREAEAEEEK